MKAGRGVGFGVYRVAGAFARGARRVLSYVPLLGVAAVPPEADDDESDESFSVCPPSILAFRFSLTRHGPHRGVPVPFVSAYFRPRNTETERTRFRHRLTVPSWLGINAHGIRSWAVVNFALLGYRFAKPPSGGTE